MSGNGRTAVIGYRLRPADSGPGGPARSFTVVDVLTGAVRRGTLPLPFLRALAVSPDGSQAVVTGFGGGYGLVDLVTGRIPEATADRHVLSAGYAPDGRPVVSQVGGALEVAGRPLATVDPGAVGASLAIAGDLVITTGDHLIAARAST